MIKKFSVKRAFLTLIILGFGLGLLSLIRPGLAIAQTDSISTAVDIVNKFDAELLRESTPLRGYDEVDGFVSVSTEEKKETVTKLKSLRLTEAPGRWRFQRVYSIVEAYTAERIQALMKLKASLPRKEGARLDAAVKRIGSFKDNQLTALRKTSKYETLERRGGKVVPSIDRSRYDDTPGTQKGIWER